MTRLSLIEASMLDGMTTQVAELPSDLPPLLMVVVDAEAEFEWGRPFSRHLTAVTAMRSQHLAQRILAAHGVRPTYVVDFPVSSHPDGYLPLKEIHADGGCQIGAHLHPWTNPPFTEQLCERNSYAGNLPRRLERAKLARLTAAIRRSFGLRPRIYKAGRYGIGPATSGILNEFGYEIDLSVLPHTDLSAQEGPNFRRFDPRPRWLDGGMLELPMTVGFTGLLADRGPLLQAALGRRRAAALRLPALFARARLLERITLTPEGITFAEQRRLTESLLRAGHRVFSFTYHSPSLAPGNTPYVRDSRDLDAFLANIDRYLEYFLGKLGGRPTTPDELRELCLRGRGPIPGVN